MSQTVDSVTTDYTLDIASGLTQVLGDGTNTYLYGLGRISQHTTTNTDYYLADALGSVRQLTDGSGAVSLTKSYTPFGEVLSSVGDGASSYGYAGDWRDSTGMIYLRARYYSPETGRFVTRDTWQGNYTRPLSLNRWNYVESNPINRVDPTGHAPGMNDDFPPEPFWQYDDEHGLCVNFWNIGCSGTIESNRKLIGTSASLLPYEWTKRWNSPQTWNDAALVFTDAAFVFSSAGAITEAAFSGIGLGSSGIPGAVFGAIFGNIIHQTVFNPVESAFSGVALAATLVGNWHSGELRWCHTDDMISMYIGENSATAIATTVAGTVMTVGVTDALIDSYAADYAHGNAPGVLTIADRIAAEFDKKIKGESIRFGPVQLQFGR